MKSKVYFINFKATPKANLFSKLNALLDAAGLDKIISKRDLTAVKLHFGEFGNTAYIRPVYLGQIVNKIKACGAKPFLTDANTLYAGTRSNTPSHLETAITNGFAYSVVNAPLVIADGLRGRSEMPVTINQNRFKQVYIAAEIVQADALISVAHFKGHELSGFGGSIKNLGMGCASRRGKLDQHSTVCPKIIKRKCIGCESCLEHCSQGAISMDSDKAKIDEDKCIGCGECILICPNEAVQISWNQSIPSFLESMVEYTLGVLKNKTNKTLFINFINAVSPACDCYAYNDAPIVRDIGILASTDPVAIDQASVDLVNKESALPESSLKENTAAGEDKFRGMYPNVNWEIQLDYANQLGLGNREYDLIPL